MLIPVGMQRSILSSQVCWGVGETYKWTLVLRRLLFSLSVHIHWHGMAWVISMALEGHFQWSVHSMGGRRICA
jgi:hypothetical protein